jgi:putative flavoprotein involved in K+ transport
VRVGKADPSPSAAAPAHKAPGPLHVLDSAAVPERFDAVVIGGGQAGLSASYELTQRGVDHVVLERGRIGQTWSDLWESFCLVTPNWSVRLPGHPYDGDDPDGFMPRDEIVHYLEWYAAATRTPIREGTEVTSIGPRDGRFTIRTASGTIEAGSVIVSTGAYQRPYRPPGAGTLREDLVQLDARSYEEPAQLPEGRVLVVGAGQSGCQIAEELHEAGRDVVLSCGRAPWLPRRFGGHDLVWWLVETGFLDVPVGALPAEARLWSNPLASGHGGGHDLHLRTLHAMGVTLAGRFLGEQQGRFRFGDNLTGCIAWGDDRYRDFRELALQLAAERGFDATDALLDPEPLEPASVPELDAAGFGSVVLTGGFRPDYLGLIDVSEAFDDVGFPLHIDGQSTVVPGLFFVGVHLLRKRKSAIFYGVGEDAAVVAQAVAARS